MMLISFLFSNITMADEFGTVIKINGRTDIQQGSTQMWVQIKRGQKIHVGDKIKTAHHTKLHILNADGSMTRVKDKKNFIYQGVKRNSLTTGGWESALIELKDKRSRKASAASRGLASNQDIWMGLMRQQPLTEEDAEGVFVLSSWYEYQHTYNRQVALLWKLGNDLGDDELKKQASQKYSNQFKWRVDKFIDGKVSKANFEDVLREGDEIQISFSPKQESYYYLFSTTQSLGKSLETSLVYPSRIGATKHEQGIKYFEARIAGGVDFKSPMFTLDNAVGNEHLWGWGCSGPILDAWMLQRARDAVVDILSKSSLLTVESLVKSTPNLCYPFALSLKHLRFARFR